MGKGRETSHIGLVKKWEVHQLPESKMDKFLGLKKAPTKADSHAGKQATEEEMEVQGPVLNYIPWVSLLFFYGGVILIDSWQWLILIESEWLIDGDLIVTLWPMK